MNDNTVPKNKTLETRNFCDMWTKVEYCSYIWTIPQYYEHYCLKGNIVTSSIFKSPTNDKYRWSLTLNECNGTIKARIQAMVEDKKLCEEMLIKRKISVINGKRDKTQIPKESPFEKMAYESSSIFPLQYCSNFLPFMSRHDVLKKDLFSEDGTLTVFCEIYFMPNPNEFSKTPYHVKDRSLQKDFEHLLGNEDFSDFVVSIDGKKYPVHKNILAARSKVFASMLKQEMEETNQNQVEICDIDEKVFEEMLRYMYTGECPNLDNLASDLLSAADKYDLQNLKTICEYSLIDKLTIESVVDSLILADTFRAAFLKYRAIRFIKLHFKELKKTDSWLKIRQSVFFDDVLEVLLS